MLILGYPIFYYLDWGYEIIKLVSISYIIYVFSVYCQLKTTSIGIALL
jgi:hypothetical protein